MTLPEPPEKQDISLNHEPPITPNKDPKTHITPYAFKVAPELLGLPLASPLRRLSAVLIDALIVTILTSAPQLLLAILATSASIRVIDLSKVSVKWLRKIYYWLIGSIIFITVLAVTSDRQLISYHFDDEEANVALEQSAASTPAETEAHLSNPVDSDRQNASDTASNFSILSFLKSLADDIGLTAGWMGLYFTLALAWWQGQTLGKRLLGIQVIKLNGQKISLWAAFERFGGYAAGFATGLLGFIQVYWDANRQAIHDKVSATAVIDTRKPRIE
ncbi:MAG: RDD family protein [Pseudomonadota bacterium]